MKLITAHDLLTGEVVYRTEANDWNVAIEAAAIYDDDAAPDALARAKKEATTVVNAYLVEADGPATPSARVRLRETIRAQGPTVRMDLGKQAEQR